MKKHKHPTWLRRLYITVFSGAIALALIFFGLNLYTTKAAIPLIEAYAAKQGIDLKIRKIDGWFPVRADISHISYAHKGLGKAYLENVRIELYKIPVLRRRLRVQRLVAERADITIEKSLSEPKSSAINWPNPFFGVEFNNLNLKETHLFGTSFKKPIAFSLQAKGMMDRGADKAELRASANQTSPFQETIVASFKATKRTRFIETSLELSEDADGWAHEILKPYMAVKQASLHIDISGHISSWLSWARGKVGALSKVIPRLKGEVWGSMELANKPHIKKDPWIEALIGANLKLKADFSLSSHQMLHFKNISLDSSTGKVQGNTKINFHEKRVREADLAIKIAKIPPFAAGYGIEFPHPFECKINIQGLFNALDIDFSCYKQNLRLANQNIENLSGSLNVNSSPGALSGSTNFFCYLQNRRFDLKGAMESSGGLLRIQNLNLKSSDDTLTASGNYSLQEKKWQSGHIDLDAKHFSFFNKITKVFPDELTVGRIRGSGNFAGDTLKYKGRISQLELGDLYTRQVQFSGNINALFNGMHGDVACYFMGGAVGRIQLPEFNLSSSLGKKTNTFEITAAQNTENFAFKSAGEWDLVAPKVSIKIKALEGEIDTNSFALKNGGHLVIDPLGPTLEPTLIQTGKGFISLGGGEKNDPSWRVKLQALPAAFVRLYSPNLSASGSISGDFIFDPTQQKRPKLKTHLLFQNLSIAYSQWPIIDQRSGSIQCSLATSGLDVTASMRNGSRQTLFFSMQLPADVAFAPFSFKPAPSRAFKVDLKANENAANFLQYLNSAGHALGGHLVGEISASGSLESPSWSGAMTLSNGRYENYQTGMILTDVNIDLLGDDSRIELKSLKASDPKGGALTAYGNIGASPYHRFPFELSALFENSLVVNIDDVQTGVSGLAQLNGSLDKVDIKSKLTVTSAHIDIPDTIKTTPPSLNVEFIHQRQKQYEDAFDFSFAKKMHLDVTLDTESTVEVVGRGLQSKWSGSVSTSGTVANPNFKGKLTLSEGTFKFAKITFNLTEGVISFDGPAKKTDLSLVAEQTVSDLNVYIALRGPLISPHLTLSSSPDLPLSNLLSRILFNKDISEIDPFQALQLAQTALQISSGEGNVMDRIQNSVGLDVFSFTSPSSNTQDEGENDSTQPGTDDDSSPMTVAVQVGKYITRGILLTVTQGTTAESSRYNVDVDLKYGLMLQLETTNQGELKTSLLWSKTY